ncbi:MAG: hypothetical protein ICV64_04270 [Thermoleophilia bacterium]|nr:hypothetical protein [Thermoleophilia bacterium]
MTVWDAIAGAAARESTLWEDALRPAGEREDVAVFSPLGDSRFEVAVETIYEGYLAHYGRPRLFAPPDPDVALLLGDFLYARGLVEVAGRGEVRAVGRLAALISLCARLRAERGNGDGAAWAATAALLHGEGELDGALASASPADLLGLARAAAGADPVDLALAAHERRLR